MFTDFEGAKTLAEALVKSVGSEPDVDVGVAPPFPFLASVKEAVAGTNILVGAQNMHFEREGAFTGEVSAGMLKSLAVDFVILGHSERRHVFGEKDELINKKVLSALSAGIKVILCVGETLEEREAGRTLEVVDRQLTSGLNGVENMADVVIAYEPVWAIGTGKTATPETAQEVHAAIRKRLAELYSPETAAKTRVQYGGSVKPANVSALMAMEDIDGALVGGASLKADSFTALVNFNKEI